MPQGNRRPELEHPHKNAERREKGTLRRIENTAANGQQNRDPDLVGSDTANAERDDRGGRCLPQDSVEQELGHGTCGYNERSVHRVPLQNPHPKERPGDDQEFSHRDQSLRAEVPCRQQEPSQQHRGLPRRCWRGANILDARIGGQLHPAGAEEHPQGLRPQNRLHHR